MTIDQTLLLNPSWATVPTGQEKVWIKAKELPGLYLEVRGTGKRTWFGYLVVNGKQHRKRLGDASKIPYLSAQGLYKEWAGQLLGPSTQMTINQAILKVEDAFFKYFKRHVMLNNARPREVLAGYKKYWADLAPLPVAALTRDIVRDWMAKIGTESGKETANRQYNTFRACIRYAVDNDLVILVKDPFYKVKRFKSLPEINYLQKGVDFESMMAQLDSCPAIQAVWIVKLLLWTAQRKGNVLAMRWDQIDLNAGTWTIPPRGYKTRRQHTAALSEKAIEVLKQISRTDSPWVFPSKRSVSGHRENIEHVWYELRSKAGLSKLTINGLRHTTGTWMAKEKTNGFVIQKMYGHTNPATTQRYLQMCVNDVTLELDRIQANI